MLGLICICMAQDFSFEPLIELVNEGRITENRIDEAVYPILLAKFRLGLFEKAQVDLSLASEIMFNESHQKTALELARQGICPIEKR